VATAESRTPRAGPRAWLAVAFAVFSVAWFGLSYALTPLVSDDTVDLVYWFMYDAWAWAGAVMATVFAVRHGRQLLWAPVVAGTWLLAIGDTLWDLSEHNVIAIDNETPSVMDLFYLPTYATLVVTAWGLVRRYNRGRGTGYFLDTTVVAGAAGAALLPVMLGPYLGILDAKDKSAQIFQMFFPAADLLLVGVFLVTMLSGRALPPVRCLGLTALMILLADQGFVNAELTDSYGFGIPWIDWMYLAQYTFMAAAVSYPLPPPAEPPESARFGTVSPGRVVVLVIGALLCPALFLAIQFFGTDGVTHDRIETIYAIGTFALTALVCVRLVNLLGEQARTTSQLRGALEERERLSSDLEHQARHDAVTGLPNRYHLADHADLILSLPDLDSTGVTLPELSRDSAHAVVFLDLDDFKAVNDTCGHEAGDYVLRETARRLQLVCGRDDVVARLGGDEFAVLLPGSTTGQAAELARAMVELVNEPIMVQGRPVRLGASVGIAELRQGPGRYAEALAEADVAMYAAKRAGKNRVKIFAEEMRRDLLADADLAADLTRAVRERRVEVAYQPIVRLTNARIVGVEALARWHEPGRGDISPSVFLPIAQRRGLISTLDLHVLDVSLADLARWRRAMPDLRVGVNASAETVGRADLVEQVQQALTRHGLPGSALVVEVTEQAMVEDIAGAAQRLEELRRHGVRIGLDDFGTGYSSLAALQDLPVDSLKLDRSFLARGITDGTASPLLRTVVQLGHDLGMSVIAEGIETAEHYRTARELGCDFGQGWLMTRPMTASDVPRLLTKPDMSWSPVASAMISPQGRNAGAPS
jgi:diguanylate cyclase (GGDEF)-like protein